MQNQPSGCYNSEHLKMLTRVLEEALAAAAKKIGLPISDARIQELGEHLGKVIMDHFTAGEVDPEVLTTIAIESIPDR